MAYVINRFNGTQLVVLEDGTLDTSTSVGLVGRNYTGYGEIQNENFLFLLENFANPSPPARPLSGQTWYSSFTKTLNIYDGSEWKAVGSAVLSATQPAGAEGALWLNPNTNQLYVYNEEWRLVGPDAVDGYGVTKTRSRVIEDDQGTEHPIVEFVLNDEIMAVVSQDEFNIGPDWVIENFNRLYKGFNLSGKLLDSELQYHFIGPLKGNAESASRLYTPRTINGVAFDGQTNITITSNTTKTLKRGDYIVGSDFNGNVETTWSVNANSNNVIGSIVARDSAGNFDAGTITADLVGNVTGDITSSNTSTFNIIQANEVRGVTLTGNASSANKLIVARTINGVAFDGTQDITVTASAGTLTGAVLAAGVTQSSLTKVGFLSNLNVADAGVSVGNNGSLLLGPDSSENARVRSGLVGKELKLEVRNGAGTDNFASIRFVPGDVSVLLGGENKPALLPQSSLSANLGIGSVKWNSVYANVFSGTATTAQYADLAEKYTADAQYEPGTVVMFGGTHEVTLAAENTNRVAGVISTNPAYLMNSELHDTNVVVVALTGRVPVMVTGNIKKGDMLVSAGNGRATACEKPEIGTVIGKALADFSGADGIIEVVVGRL